ncbi:MAG: energy transducer TonB [Verrucomicrobia bacterium]|nr:energy transducer TonB [Verrucomicrobiota bacterium]
MNAAASPLLFEWPAHHRRYRALLLFLVASVLLHAFCFYIFQVVYPTTVALLPAPARITVISPDAPDSMALLRWVEAQDPALASATQRPTDYRPLPLPELKHLPSYAKHEPALRTLPEARPDWSIPSSAAIGSVPGPQHTPLPPFPAIKSTALFADLRPELGAPVLPEFSFHLSRPDAPANARFRVAIDHAGAVRFCFLVQSSGDAQLDDQAREFLLLCRFSPRAPNAPLLWSEATLLWGNDLAPPPPATPDQ